VGLFIGSTYAGSGIALIVLGAVLGVLKGQPDVVLPVLGSVRDWQLAFMLASLSGLLFIALLGLVREPPRSSASGIPVADPVPIVETFRFMGAHLGRIVPIYVGIPLLAAANFAMNAWVPTFFIRTFGWEASAIGPVFGLMVIVCGTGGTVAGGVLSDRLTKQGVGSPGLLVRSCRRSPPLRSCSASRSPAMPRHRCGCLPPRCSSGAMPFGAGTAGIVEFAPNRMRGQMVAIYMLIATLVGTGGGPWMIAMWTDHVIGIPARSAGRSRSSRRRCSWWAR
jgi:MFS family permease